MKRLYYILLGVFVIWFIAGCSKVENEFTIEDSYKSGIISPFCMIESNSLGNYISGALGTKSLINQKTPVDTILCNFLIIDDEDLFDSENTNWSEARISESSVSTILNGALRTISLQPEQPYHTENKGHKSRMIGWYPRTCNLPENTDNNDVTSLFKDFTSSCIINDGTVSLKFSGLDGSKDIMVSDIREGSYNEPFDKNNSFTFKHYLSAVRIYAKAENSSQDLGIWGDITKVVILNQPSSCQIVLPQKIYNESKGVTGFADSTNVTWGNENVKNPIVTTPIFGEKDINNPNNIVAEEYPVNISGSTTEKYLGYSLIRPNNQLWVQIHTKTGIYDVKIEPSYNETSIFNAGYIYDIHLNFKTDGTISAYLLKDGSDTFYDLTSGKPYQAEGSTVFQYNWANCYIVNSAPTGEMANYAGFCFDATVVGNGEGGLMSFGAQSLYPTNVHIFPTSADLLWETSPGLISQIELIFGYVRFKVAKDPDDSNKYKEGNAVIAVYDSSGKILWSWHIWITDTPQDASYTEGGTTITLLDRNLGATAAKWEGSDVSSGDTLETYGLYYQWGRKDPSMGPPSKNYHPINMTTAPYYDYSSTTKDAAEVLRLPAPTLQDAVENPMYLIMPTAQTQTYYFNWLYEKIDFLWGYDKDRGTNERKTIYDPCPYGYKVSGGELADLFSSKQSSYQYDTYGQKVTNDGRTFYFPYTGYKGVDRGLNSLVSSWKYVGKKADYQSSVVSVYTEDEEYYMHRARIYLSNETSWSELNVGQYTGRQIEDHTNRRTAAPVRCVKNEMHNRVMAFITPNKTTISEASDYIDFTLYAESFSANISSATLSIGYHMKDGNGEGPHQEYVLQEWNNINSQSWNNGSQVYKFTFNSIIKLDGSGNKTGEYIDINETTGNFRFILHVKTTDNINKITSTTITIANNQFVFPEKYWGNNTDSYPTAFTQEPIDKDFMILASEKVSKVEINSVEIVANESEDPGDYGYNYVYMCSTEGLSFNSTGWHPITITATFVNGDTFSETRYIKVGTLNVSSTPVSSVDFDSNKYYVIQNSNNGYVYDAGNGLRATSNVNNTNLFRIISSDGRYKIKNVYTGDYIFSDGYSSSVSPAVTEGEASVYTIEGNNSPFTITITLSGSKRYWRQNNNSSNVSLALSDGTNRKWKFYEVTQNFDGIPSTPN